MSRNLGGYDIVFTVDGGALGFNLAHDAQLPAVVNLQQSPARTDQVVQNADVPRVLDNLDAGMGFSRRISGAPPNGYAYCFPGYTRAPGGVFMPAGKLTELALPSLSEPASGQHNAIIKAVPYNGQIYLITKGPEVLQLSADGLSATTVHYFGPSFNGSGAAVFNNKLYISGGAAGLGSLDSTGTWAGPTATVQRLDLAVANWRPLGIPTDVLIGISVENTWCSVRWCPITADPMNPTAWSAPIAIGSQQRFPAGPILATPRHAFISARDGLFDIDELGTRAFNIAPWIAEHVELANGQWGLPLGNGIYYAHAEGLAFIQTTGETQYRPEWAQPAWGLPYEGPIRGMPVAGTLHDGWGLTTLTPNAWGQTAQTYLCAGRRIGDAAGMTRPYGNATHIWHGAEAILDDTVSVMAVLVHIPRDTNPRLLICTTDWANPTGGATTRVRAFWQSLPRWGTPLQELSWGGSFEPADAAQLFLPADPFDAPSAVKTLLELDLVTERLNPGTDLFNAYASADLGAWAPYGTADLGLWWPMAPLEVVEGRWISVRIDAVGHPLLRSIETRAALGIETREARQYRVILAWDNALKGARSRETADPDQRWLDLKALQGRIVYLDEGLIEGPCRVRVLQVLSGERRRLGGAQRAGSNGTEGAWAITATLLVSFLDKPFRFDGPPTDVYDADRVWA